MMTETGYLTNIVRILLEEHGELSAMQIAAETKKPLDCIRWLLYCRKCFGQNEQTGRWGLRERR